MFTIYHFENFLLNQYIMNILNYYVPFKQCLGYDTFCHLKVSWSVLPTVYFCSVIGRIKGLNDVHILISITCKYVISYAKKNLEMWLN